MEATVATNLFLLPNGKKFILKKVAELRKQLEENPELIKELSKEINYYEKMLELPIKHAKEQNEIVSYGNGVNILLNGKPKFIVIDGVCVAKHRLPENNMIISAESPAGKALIGKKVGDSFFYKVGSCPQSVVIKKIIPPSEAKWVFRNPNYVKNN